MKKLTTKVLDFATKLNTDIVSLCLASLCVLAVFCYYGATNIILFTCAILLLFVKGSLKKIFSNASSFFAFIFLALTIIVGFYYRNNKGLILSFTFVMVAIVGFYLRSVMTAPLFEWMLNLVQFACFVIFISCTIAKIINIDVPNYRCTLWFGNCNYLGSIMAGCTVVCVYKEVTHQGSSIINYLLAIGCAICIYLTGSLFAVAEMLVGVFALLVLTRKHKLLLIFLSAILLACVLLYLFPEIYPRASDSVRTTNNRVLVWQGAISNIDDCIVFGKGFFTYRMFENVPFPAPHTHNFVLECLISFGIIGSSLLASYFILYYKVVFVCNQLLRKSSINILILALSAGVLIHATTDMTMLWPQTGLFYALILAGIGADERKLEHIKHIHHH